MSSVETIINKFNECCANSPDCGAQYLIKLTKELDKKRTASSRNYGRSNKASSLKTFKNLVAIIGYFLTDDVVFLHTTDNQLMKYFNRNVVGDANLEKATRIAYDKLRL